MEDESRISRNAFTIHKSLSMTIRGAEAHDSEIFFPSVKGFVSK